MHATLTRGAVRPSRAMDVQRLEAHGTILAEFDPESSPGALVLVETRTSRDVAPARVGVLLQNVCPRAARAVAVEVPRQPKQRNVGRGKRSAGVGAASLHRLLLGGLWLLRRGPRCGQWLLWGGL